MKILVACEFSGIVREAFRKRGHDAWSCDLEPTESEGQHIEGNVLPHLDDGWDLLIAHPPCTHLCASGARWWETKQREQRQAIWFFLALANCDIPKICVENPVCIMSTKWRKPDQIIQPYQFGHDASKATCLWLKNLPKLRPTEKVPPRIVNGKPRWANQTDSGQNKLGPSPTRSADRAKTYQGIANAMASQWG